MLLKTNRSKYQIIIFSFLLIVDLFISKEISDFSILAISLFWVYCVITLKIRFEENIGIAASMFLIALISRIFERDMIMEKGASWFFVFLTISLFQRLLTANANREENTTK